MPKIIFVLGGPGAGKGTICEKLQADHGFHHLSAGELLRGEMNREGSKYGKMIMEINQAGKINPSWLTVGLIETAINERMTSDESVFLIDGFPRNQENYDTWMKQIDQDKFKLECCLFLHCSLAICEERILKRAESGDRADDNLETLRKRFKSYEEIQLPIINIYKEQGTCEQVNTESTRDENFKLVLDVMKRRNLI